MITIKVTVAAVRRRRVNEYPKKAVIRIIVMRGAELSGLGERANQ